MGWSRVGVLEQQERSDGPVAVPPELYHRRGLEGVEIHHAHYVIKIPRQLLLEMVAEEYVNRRISKLEQMTAEDVKRELFGSR